MAQPQDNFFNTGCISFRPLFRVGANFLGGFKRVLVGTPALRSFLVHRPDVFKGVVRRRRGNAGTF